MTRSIAALLLSAGVASAAATWWTRSASDIGLAGAVDENTGIVYGAPTASRSEGAITTVRGLTFGSAAPGTLSGYSWVTAPWDYDVYAQSNLEFSDYLLVTSSVLPVGAPVRLRFSVFLDGWMTGTGSSSTRARVHLSWNPHLSSARAEENCRYAPPVGCESTATGPVTMNTFVGSNVNIKGSLMIDARAWNVGSAESSYGSTAHFYGDAVTAGVTLVSESGHDYTSVPEPATVALVPLSLAGLAVIRARRTRPRG